MLSALWKNTPLSFIKNIQTLFTISVMQQQHTKKTVVSCHSVQNSRSRNSRHHSTLNPQFTSTQIKLRGGWVTGHLPQNHLVKIQSISSIFYKRVTQSERLCIQTGSIQHISRSFYIYIFFSMYTPLYKVRLYSVYCTIYCTHRSVINIYKFVCHSK